MQMIKINDYMFDARIINDIEYFIKQEVFRLFNICVANNEKSNCLIFENKEYLNLIDVNNLIVKNGTCLRDFNSLCKFDLLKNGYKCFSKNVYNITDLVFVKINNEQKLVVNSFSHAFSIDINTIINDFNCDELVVIDWLPYYIISEDKINEMILKYNPNSVKDKLTDEYNILLKQREDINNKIAFLEKFLFVPEKPMKSIDFLALKRQISDLVVSNAKKNNILSKENFVKLDKAVSERLNFDISKKKKELNAKNTYDLYKKMNIMGDVFNIAKELFDA